MTTTADTDDTNPRLAALEADVRNINVQLERMHVEQQESRREHAADNRQLNSRIDQTNAKIDELGVQVNGKIDQVSAQTNGKIDQVSEQLNGKIDQVSAQTNGKIDQVSAQTNARIDQTNAKIDRLTYLLMGGMVTILAGLALVYFRTGG